jgi:hypothetical protein
MFAKMRQGEPVVFADMPVPVRNEDQLGVGPAVVRALANGLPRDFRIRTRCGPSSVTRSLSAAELLGRWQNNRSSVAVTDLHIRGTRVMRMIDSSSLSDFNILADARGMVAEQEMLTVVVSSAGTFTDSHSDDPDGTNHCFVGRKLWLVWDTFTGLAHGLEDVERAYTCGDGAAFDMAAFLAMPSSRWFVIEPGQTLFLPGHLTHRVITLDDYLGVGSFFVMLPSYLRTLHRWTVHGPLWALNGPREKRLALVDKITCRVTTKLKELRRASPSERRYWGIGHLYVAYADFSRRLRAAILEGWFASPASADLKACIAEDLMHFAGRKRADEPPAQATSARAVGARRSRLGPSS